MALVEVVWESETLTLNKSQKRYEPEATHWRRGWPRGYVLGRHVRRSTDRLGKANLEAGTTARTLFSVTALDFTETKDS